MPTYDYRCQSCNHELEAFQSMSDPALTLCPECGEDKLKRSIGGGMGVIFKGSGFYVNDSKSKSCTTPSGSKSDNCKGCQKSKVS